MKPICVPCERFMRPKRNGFYFIEGMPIGNRAPAGKGTDAHWKPYKLWVGDLWECPDCHATVVSGVGNAPIAEHYQTHFTATVERVGGSQLFVKDC